MQGRRLRPAPPSKLYPAGALYLHEQVQVADEEPLQLIPPSHTFKALRSSQSALPVQLHVPESLLHCSGTLNVCPCCVLMPPAPGAFLSAASAGCKQAIEKAMTRHSLATNDLLVLMLCSFQDPGANTILLIEMPAEQRKDEGDTGLAPVLLLGSENGPAGSGHKRGLGIHSTQR
jgi:hypothetical protein